MRPVQHRGRSNYRASCRTRSKHGANAERGVLSEHPYRRTQAGLYDVRVHAGVHFEITLQAPGRAAPAIQRECLGEIRARFALRPSLVELKGQEAAQPAKP